MENEIYIPKKGETREDTDFVMLQKSALETVQRLSGNVWTDFNEHDPGITIMDAFNYALSELRYKAGFPFPDYLSEENKEFVPRDFGLYRPYEVYPSAPVTVTDYRKLIFDRTQKITDLWLSPSPGRHPGYLDVIVDLNPSVEESTKTHICEQVQKIFHENRNLGEMLGDIHFIERKTLELRGDILLHDNADPSETLAEIYFECAKYFTPGIQYHDLRKLVSEDEEWPDILEGPLTENGIIKNDSIKPIPDTYYVSGLHSAIRKVQGVKTLKTLLVLNEGKAYSEEIRPDSPLHSFTISFPRKEENILLSLQKNERETDFDFNTARKYYKKLIAVQFGQHNRMQNLENYFETPQSSYQAFSEYFSLQNEFPEFYGINHKGIPAFYPDERKAQTKQLKAYLLIFDLLMAATAMDMEQLPSMLKIKGKLPNTIFPDLSASVSHWDELVARKQNQAVSSEPARFWINARNSVFDMLDSMYGEKSYLPFLNEFNVYSSPASQATELLEQRSNFIQQLPEIIPQRAKAADLLKEQPDNVPGLKKWFAALLGLPAATEIPVTNVFSNYSLRLLSDDEFYSNRGILNIDFVVNKLKENFRGETVFDIQEENIENTDDLYQELNEKIYLFRHNIVFESFLRNGIHLSRYKIIQIGKGVFLLAYRAEEQQEWISMGRFSSRTSAAVTANQLCKFLVELNRHSENLYFVEHLLLCPIKKKDGYLLKADDEQGNERFVLLHPVSRDEIKQLKDELDKLSREPGFFELTETYENNFTVHHKLNGENALYCTQAFDTRDEAEQFRNKILKPQKFRYRVFYQHSENILFEENFIDFGITIVFPGWSARFNNSKFRSYCEETLEERCPAHLKLNFLWLEAPEIRTFEKLYFSWREAFANQQNTDNASIALAGFLAKKMYVNE